MSTCRLILFIRLGIDFTLIANYSYICMAVSYQGPYDLSFHACTGYTVMPI